MTDVMDKKKQQGTPEKDAEAEKELTILQPGAVPEEDEDPEAPYLASDMYQRIVALINNFESGLPGDMQAGGRLVSAGDITFSIQDIGYWDPNMIVFYGELSDGSAVELVQHIFPAQPAPRRRPPPRRHRKAAPHHRLQPQERTGYRHRPGRLKSRRFRQGADRNSCRFGRTVILAGTAADTARPIDVRVATPVLVLDQGNGLDGTMAGTVTADDAVAGDETVELGITGDADFVFLSRPAPADGWHRPGRLENKSCSYRHSSL